MLLLSCVARAHTGPVVCTVGRGARSWGAAGAASAQRLAPVMMAARFSTRAFPQRASRRLDRSFSLRRVFSRRWSTTVGLAGGTVAPPAELLTWSAIRQRLAASVESHSFIWQGIMAGFFYCLGDFTAQGVEYANKARERGDAVGTWAYDWRRTVRMGTFGLLIAGPMLAGWYRTLHAVTKVYRYSYEPLVGLPAVLHRMRVPGACQQSTVYQGKCLVQENGAKQLWYNVAANAVADNCLFQPFFLTCYFVGMGVLEGQSYDHILEKTKADFRESLLPQCNSS